MQISEHIHAIELKTISLNGLTISNVHIVLHVCIIALLKQFKLMEERLSQKEDIIILKLAQKTLHDKNIGVSKWNSFLKSFSEDAMPEKDKKNGRKKTLKPKKCLT